MSSQVLLYSGTGAGPFCTKALETQLDAILDGRFHITKRITSFPECYSDPASIKAVFVPGGNAAQMLCATTSQSKSSLQNLFNKHFSSYYGACAGGLLASSGIFETFNKGEDIQCMRQTSYPALELFPGKAIAPLFPKLTNNRFALTDFRQLCIHSSLQTAKTFTSIHILSPGYLDIDKIVGAEILSTYDPFPTTFRFAGNSGTLGPIIDPASLSESLFYQSGASRMVLTGSHPEITSKTVGFQEFKTAFSATNEEQLAICEKMQGDDPARHEFLKTHFERLGLACIK